MAKIPNRSLLWIDLLTITFLFLLWQNIVIVRPDNGVNDGVNKRTIPRDEYLRFTNGEGMGKISYRRAGEMGRGTDASQKEESKIQSFQITGSIQTLKKPRFLCLHGSGSNAATLEKELNVWPKSVIDMMDLVFINGPFSLNDSTSSVNEGFKWFTVDEWTYKNFDEGIAYIEDFMVEFGPFDGVLGFSQGAIVAGALPGMQEQGVSLTRVGKIQHVVIISGAKLGGNLFHPAPKLAQTAFSSPINIPSLHIFGENDEARPSAPELVEAYVDPLVIYHHGGHEVPKLDKGGLEIMYEFLKKINELV